MPYSTNKNTSFLNITFMVVCCLLSIKTVGALTRYCQLQNSTVPRPYNDETHACVHCGDTVDIMTVETLQESECCNGTSVMTKLDCYFSRNPGAAFGNEFLNESLPDDVIQCSDAIQCDGVKQCASGADEVGCRQCSGTSQFSCNTFFDTEGCIPNNKVCDGRKHCEEGLDEMNCPYYKGWCDGFLCGYPDHRCIPFEQVCDGTKQCVDGSDETNCKYCLHQFSCNVFNRPDDQATTANCVGTFRICDGVRDCENGLDESQCHRWHEWTPWSSCDPKVTCERNRTRLCLDSKNAVVSPDHCYDYLDDDGLLSNEIDTSPCPACQTTTTETTDRKSVV